MEQIIQQIALRLAKIITEKSLEGGLSDIDSLASDVLSDCKTAACRIVEAIVSEMNIQIRKDKALRKEAGLVLKEKDRPRALLTELGGIDIRRDYYRHRNTNSYCYLLDEMLGITPYARIGDTVKAKLISNATEVSYSKSSRIVTEGNVSRQTVHSLIASSPVFDIAAPEEKKAVRTIHIYADEDHVHLQRPFKMRGKANRIVPLITISEGVERECKNRNHTINPKHFVDEKFDTEKLWESVDSYLMSSFKDYGKIPVYIYGDGGGWIKQGLNWISGSSYVVDGYHYERDLRQVAGIKPELRFKKSMHFAALMNNRGQAEKAVAKLKDGLTGKELESVKTFEKYISENWEAVVRRNWEDTVGSCTEAQVSHVLSERFSRNPMGWSKEVLGKLSKARVYKLNGGEITAQLLKKESRSKTAAEEFAKDILRHDIGGNLDWSIFDECNAMNASAHTSFYVSKTGNRTNLYS